MSSNVCENQDRFNDAYRSALQNDQEKRIEENKNWMNIYAVLWLISLVWAIFLALKADEEHRVLHLVHALVFSPLYVLAYYIGAISMEKSAPSQTVAVVA